jgi:hypothetical protein
MPTDYVQNPSGYFLFTGTATLITGNALSFDGTTEVKIECFVRFATNFYNGGVFTLYLYEDGVPVGIMSESYSGDGFGGAWVTPMYGAVFLTPTAGTHTYEIIMSCPSTGTTVSAKSWYRLDDAGTTLAYEEFNPLTVTSTSSVTPDTVVTLPVVGSGRVRVELFSPLVVWVDELNIELDQDGSRLGQIGDFRQIVQPFFDSGDPLGSSSYMARFVDLAAGSHTFVFGAWKTGRGASIGASTVSYVPSWGRVIQDVP